MGNAIHGKAAQIRLTTTPSVTFTNEATTANSALTEYRISNAAKVHIDDSASVTVQAGHDEIQTVTVNATGGTYTLTFGANTTGNIAFNALASAVQTALAGLPSVGSGNVAVTGSAGGPYTVRFQASLGLANQAQMTADSTNLSGGTHTATVATVQNGSAYATISSGFSLRYAGGVVVFDSAQVLGTQVRMSGKYFPWAAIANGRSFKLKLTRDVKEDTVLPSNSTPTAFRTYKPGLVGGEFEVVDWFVDTTYLGLITSETRLYCGLVLDVTTGARFDCAAIMQSGAINAALEELEDETLGFKITGGVYLAGI